MHAKNDLYMVVLRPTKLLCFNPNLYVLVYSENSGPKYQNAMEEYSYLISDSPHNAVLMKEC